MNRRSIRSFTCYQPTFSASCSRSSQQPPAFLGACPWRISFHAPRRVACFGHKSWTSRPTSCVVILLLQQTASLHQSPLLLRQSSCPPCRTRVKPNQHSLVDSSRGI